MTPDFVVAGHISRDLTPGGPRIGGTASYAASVAAALGLRAAIITRSAMDPDLPESLANIDVLRVAPDGVTVFEHRFEAGKRIQYMRSRAGLLRPSDVPRSLRRAPVALLGPVIGEIDPRVAAAFPEALVGATAQGWLRRLGAGGHVQEGNVADLDASAFGGRVSVLTLSEDDLGGEAIPPAWLEAFPIVVLTDGRRGLRLWWSGRCWRMEAFPAVEQDSTGAGDAFAAAFVIRYAETDDVAASARFGAAVASFVVEAPGIMGAPNRAAVERRLERHPEIRLSPLG